MISRTPGAGGVNITPLLTPEPMVGEEQAKRRSKAIDVKILMSS